MSMFTKLKQFKDIRDQGKKLQETLGGESATSSNFGNSISITMNGNLQVTDVKIASEWLTPDKKEKLEIAIKEVHGDVLKKVQKIMASKMQEMGGFDNLTGMGGGK
ncbi:MAG: YbaB/EbfC family nucleoid-associated protein [Candidatus Magasanikbacteria bacterium]|nr:YbaB/EbfC family nucleoid-associated protein [Candidatus Magasanikbacteria bacterium]